MKRALEGGAELAVAEHHLVANDSSCARSASRSLAASSTTKKLTVARTLFLLVLKSPFARNLPQPGGSMAATSASFAATRSFIGSG